MARKKGRENNNVVGGLVPLLRLGIKRKVLIPTLLADGVNPMSTIAAIVFVYILVLACVLQLCVCCLGLCHPFFRFLQYLEVILERLCSLLDQSLDLCCFFDLFFHRSSGNGHCFSLGACCVIAEKHPFAFEWGGKGRGWAYLDPIFYVHRFSKHMCMLCLQPRTIRDHFFKTVHHVIGPFALKEETNVDGLLLGCIPYVQIDDRVKRAGKNRILS